MAHDTTRRTFLKTTAACGAAIGAAGLVTAVTPRAAQAKTLKLTPANGAVSFKLDEAAGLGAVGGSARLKIEGHEKVIVVRVTDTELKTFSIKCTHEGCNVKWTKDESMLACPCHESKFDLAGTPHGGPATTPLLSYPTTLADGTVTITIPENAPRGGAGDDDKDD